MGINPYTYTLTGVHCVPVVDDNGDIVNIISQSFLSSFVYAPRLSQYHTAPAEHHITVTASIALYSTAVASIALHSTTLSKVP
jgi:hypothetical protein